VSQFTVRGQQFKVRLGRRDGRSVAYAVRAETGDRFGADFIAASDDEAVAALTRWIEWQGDHAAALESLQEAERAYHRAVAGHMLAGDADRPAAGQERGECLERMAAARTTLDVVRARRPE